MEVLSETLISACGMNCGICVAHLRSHNPCPGCRMVGSVGPKTRVECKIKLCTERSGRFCFDCDKFPCERLTHLDERYRRKYGMSEIENLMLIRDAGMDAFMQREEEKWVSDQGILCVHDRSYYPIPE